MITLDGKGLSKKIRIELKKEVEELKNKYSKIPCLKVVIVGDDPASKIYVKSKERIAKKIGINSELIEFDKNISQNDLIDEIKKLNDDKNVNAILVQLPLPDGFDTWKVLEEISPQKDVDRFHPYNLGLTLLSRTNIHACTPSGIMELIDEYSIDLNGKNACVIGRSFIVGKPIAALLTNRNATVTLCHSRTKDIKSIVKNSDIVVAAIGKPGFVKSDDVKEGSVLIDVGINYLDDEKMVKDLCTEEEIEKFYKKGYAITGDIDIRAFEKSSYYTPVPGGIGPMTVVMLMKNTVELFKLQNNINE